MGMTLSLRDAAHDAPDHLAIVGSRLVTFGELQRLAEQATVSWRKLGWTPGITAIVPTLSLQSLVAVYALMDLGAPMTLVHPRLRREERADLIRRAGAQWLINGSKFHRTHVAPVAGVPSKTLAIVPTSGTSGRPKLVLLSRRAFEASAKASASNLARDPDDRWLLSMPLAHVGGLSVITRTLIARRTLVLGSESFSASNVAKAARVHGVSLLSLVPTMLHRLVDKQLQAPAGIRAVLLGGAAASARLLSRGRELGWPLLPTYGLTETCSQVATCRLRDRISHAGVGRPLPGVEVRIVDGEIQVRGDVMMSGYLDQPCPFVAGWLPTGDLGQIDSDGNLHLLGRHADLIITGGENVSPLEVETALMDCPGVDAACVFGVDDDEWGQLVAVAVVGDVEGRDLMAYCKGQFAAHKRPRLWVRTLGLPTNATGKVVRRSVAAQMHAELTLLR